MKLLLSNIINEKNRNTLTGLFTILLLLWIILYFIPEIFISLFNTLLGNVMLFVLSLVIMMYNVRYGIIFGIVWIVIYRFTQLIKREPIQNSKEGFKVNFDVEFIETNPNPETNQNQNPNPETNQFSNKDIQDFLQIQNSINRNTIFDLQQIKNQATPEELKYFNKHGQWPWSNKTIELYKKSIETNPYIRTYSGDAVNSARTVYNENAILQIISWQTKEGKFLINGILVSDPSGNRNEKEELPSGFGNFPYTSGILESDKRLDVIKCNVSNGSLERTHYTGKGGIYGEQTKTKTPVDYTDLENIIPGFQFLNGPCNPCVALNDPPDYSCPFQIKLKDQSPFMSQVWQYLWNVDDNPLQSVPSFLNEKINEKEFPLLSELQTELNKQQTTTTN